MDGSITWMLATATSVVAGAADLVGQDLDVVVDFAGFGNTTAHAVKAVGASAGSRHSRSLRMR